MGTFWSNESLEELLESIRKRQRLPALAAAVIVTGEIRAVAAVGTRKVRTRHRVTVNDKFLIGSCGKAFTATLAAVCVEEGLLSWQTTIGDVFPDLDMRPQCERLSLQQLLSHRSGLPMMLADPLLGDLWVSSVAPEVLRRRYLERSLQQELSRPASEVVYYSNSGYIVAGAMLEQITGQTFEDLLTEKVYRPLGLSTAGFGTPAAREPASQPFGHRRRWLVYRVIGRDYADFIAPAGLIHLSIQDWAKFVRLHLETSRAERSGLLKPDSLRTLHSAPDLTPWDTSNIGALPLEIEGRLWPDFAHSSYAMGWFTQQSPGGDRELWHGGTTRSFTAQIVLSLTTQNAILLVTNANATRKHASHRQLYEVSEAIRAHYAPEAELPLVR